LVEPRGKEIDKEGGGPRDKGIEGQPSLEKPGKRTKMAKKSH